MGALMITENQIKQRHAGIGGSDVPAILGFSPFKSAVDVYMEKINPLLPKTQITSRMKAGNYLERSIIDWFMEETGLKVRKEGKIRKHKKYPFLLGNVDGIVLQKEKGILEVKTTNSFVKKKWEEGDIPLAYFAQLQHYLNITGYEYGYFAVLVDGWDLNIYYQKRDDEFIRMMEKDLISFWEHVQNKVPPIPKTIEDIKKLYPKAYGANNIEATKETYKYYLELKNINEELKQLKNKKDLYTEALMLVMKESEVMTYNSNIIISWKNNPDRIIFDKLRFKKNNPELYSKYLIKAEGQRVFRIR